MTALLLGAILARSPASDLKTTLVGIWQQSSIMAAGWQRAYRFFPDGRFIWHESQMAGPAREPQREGKWTLTGTKLTLTTTKKIVIVGGKVHKEPPMEIGEIVGGKRVAKPIKPPLVSTFVLAEPKADKSGHLKIYLGKSPYWKHRDDPKDYQ